jgi:cyclopropane fatty-acyl-phospholipid synthase-like methyltransferase
MRTIETAEGPAEAAERAAPTRSAIEAYWTAAHDAYLAHVGTTFQAGRIAAGASMRESNVWLARAAGLSPGARVLDAGCGVCGPAIDIAGEFTDIRIVGVTLVRRQAETAVKLLANAGLRDRVRVLCADYHQLPFAEASFGVVVFLESLGYATALPTVLAEVRRVLEPGGTLYIKDVFCREPLLSDQERDELAAFDRAFMQRTPSLRECLAAAQQAGFLDVRSRDLTAIVSTEHARRAMFDRAGGLTSFGRLHHMRHSCLPVLFAELTARVPR